MESFELLDKWFVRSTQRLISMTESLICQAGARPSIAEAEGFSILNQRSAALLSQDIPDLSLPATSSTLVCHRERHLSDALELKMPFELQAASAQEAVYHCLIAHDIAAKLNIPGLCSVDDTLAQRLEGARMPTREMINMITPIFSLIVLIANESDLGNISSDKLYSIFPSNLQKSFNGISLFGSSIE